MTRSSSTRRTVSAEAGFSAVRILSLPFRWLRRLYDLVIELADKPYALPALFVVAFAEASFFPIPPDVLLIAMAISIPLKAHRYALVCALGSVGGAALGYLIGWQFYETAGRVIVEYYAAGDAYDRVRLWYEQWNALAVAAAGFTIIPFKVFTIAAGAFKINFPVFLLASAASRAARFFLVAELIRRYGAGIRELIEKYFEIFSLLAAALLVGGFLLLKYVL